MKTKLFFLLIAGVVFLAACNSSETKTETTNDSTQVAELPKTVLKVTKQYLTNADGSVTEMAVNAEIGYNEQEVSVNFKDSVDKSFTVTVTTLEKKVEGVVIMVKDRKYKEVFISSGAQPQITFSSDKGYGNMTFM